MKGHTKRRHSSLVLCCLVLVGVLVGFTVNVAQAEDGQLVQEHVVTLPDEAIAGLEKTQPDISEISWGRSKSGPLLTSAMN
jgi:hypothetical protein